MIKKTFHPINLNFAQGEKAYAYRTTYNDKKFHCVEGKKSGEWLEKRRRSGTIQQVWIIDTETAANFNKCICEVSPSGELHVRGRGE